MEISSEILETLDIVGNKDVMEVLKEEGVTEDIIFESEVAEDSEDTEIEEIIEIIEEIEECEETSDDASLSKEKDELTCAKDNGIVERNNRNEEIIDKDVEMYGFDEESSMFTSQSIMDEETKSTNNSMQKSKTKQVIKYDVDEDWQDEDMERVEELDNSSEMQTQSDPRSDKKHVNNQTVTIPLQSNRLDLKIHMDSTGRSVKSCMDSSAKNNGNSMEDNSDTTHEIVKNVENNLLYTVLGTKKQDSSTKQAQQEKVNDAQYIKVSLFSKHNICAYNWFSLTS